MKPHFRARFRLWTLLQVLGLLASAVLFAWTITATGHVAVPAVLGLVIVLQTVALLRYVQAHVDTLEEFFAAVNFEDFTRRFATDGIDAELNTVYNGVIERFQDARAARELQADYLDTLVRHVPVALIAVRFDGSLSLVNNTARRLTGLPALRHLDELSELDPKLPALLRSIEPGRQQLLQTRLRDIPVELRVAVSEMRRSGESERLYSLENLSGELTARESSAWRNLIRVLTHEIMNTLTPVTSLAHTCETLVDDPAAAGDVRAAVATIARRSEGLMHFVARYRELLQVPAPRLAKVGVLDLLSGAVTLMANELGTIDVRVDVYPRTLAVQADARLLDQVLLNLIKNAIEAMRGIAAPVLRLEGRLEHGRTLIQIRDNGPGIAADVLEQIFVPFFTTRRDGSGIGLSLSRQIITAHGGDIAVASDATGTIVSVIL